MIEKIRKISKEIYERAKCHNGVMTDEDMNEVFDEREICGYGIYSTQCYECNGEYFVKYYRGRSCD